MKVSGLNQFLVAALPAILMALMPALEAFAGANINITPDGIGGSVTAGPLTIIFGNGGGGIANALCTVVRWFTTGGVGQAIASLAVITFGIAAFFGKVTWGSAIMYTCGIFAIFGSQQIVSAITGGLASGGC